ncbi:MAG: Nmad3 family putative nucleotide modification protein [Thermoleophilia bacterium]
MLSRKGFDSSAGGIASPILPDDSLVSMPIPLRDFETETSNNSVRYSDLTVDGHNLGEIVADLSGGKIEAERQLHLDPDIRASIYPREPGWKPIFGQVDSAQTHLTNQGIASGDLFLFYGWFRRVEKFSSKYIYVRNEADMHVLFGWLQIGEMINVEQNMGSMPSWALYHPHLNGSYGSNNTVYISSESLSLGGKEIGLPGGGVFPSLDGRLSLTAKGETRSVWRLPDWFYPAGRKTSLSYHDYTKRPEDWIRDSDGVILKSVPRGQEFVLDTKDYPEAIEWVSELLGF